MTVLPGYDSIPIPVLDATISNADILARITLTFPHKLSLSLLEDSFYSLVRAWPILAARIRPTPSTPSGLSFFVPQPVTLAQLESRSRSTSKPLEQHIVLLDVSSRSLDTYHAIAGKAVNGQLSRDCISIGLAPDRQEQDKMTCTNACKSFKELLKADQSFVTAHATLFSDATVITIAFSHTLGDAFAIKSIFSAWADTLRTQTPPAALEGLGKDPYREYLPDGRNAVDQEGRELGLPLGWKKFGFVKKIRLIANLLWDIKIKRPEREFVQIYIHVPDQKVSELIAEAKADLAKPSSAKAREKERDLNISTFNVLFAFLLQNIHAANSKPRRKSSVLTIINAKTRPPAGHKPTDYPQHQLWGGAIAAPLDKLSSGHYATLPLGQVALHIRESLRQHIEPDNLQKMIAKELNHGLWKKPSGKLIFFAGPNDYWFGCTEWRSVKFNEVDFGGGLQSAVKERGLGEEKEDTRVRPVTIGTHMEIPVTQRNRWVIFGDAGGGVWLSGGLTMKEALNQKGFGQYRWVH
ncbi:probable Acetyltransferase involved in MEL production [Melanopsichium pennsylvanicum]|uniref:Acetyltransferase involved in MEL production n=2 Tax=Melanopsichium pennsylvanicum TaxID=63383 RepID=A0A077R9S6_9BASI|nr:conserved hypothetical protein [Melanopsichium pennsylvanicum 4]SNX87151.1 probable Acetyltransferase involved in MEL production [Melanopsichium pennsylvanicum]